MLVNVNVTGATNDDAAFADGEELQPLQRQYSDYGNEVCVQ